MSYTAHILTFLAMSLTDFSWARYMVNIKADDPLSASCWAVALFILGGYAVIQYTSNRWMLLSGAAGAFVGTFLGVAW